jgi:hypothetical protein
VPLTPIFAWLGRACGSGQPQSENCEAAKICCRGDESMAKTTVQKINHLNHPDNDGRVYCRMKNAIKEVTAADCFNCRLCCGSMQGMGVECEYPDMVTDNINVLALTVPDPAAQLEWITKLIDKGLIPADPLSKEGAQ